MLKLVLNKSMLASGNEQDINKLALGKKRNLCVCGYLTVPAKKYQS